MICGNKQVVSIILGITLLFSVLLSLAGCSCNGGKSPAANLPSTANPPPAVSASSSPVQSSLINPPSPSSQPSGNILVTSGDGNVSISVPSGWNTNDTQLYPGSVIGVANDASNEYLIITEKPKTSLKAGDTINDYLNIIKIAFGSAVTNPVWGQPSNVTIGGCKGLMVRLTGKRKSNNTDTVYFVNALESKNYFYNVCGYTLTSSEDANKTTLEKIINSFKEKD
jgi:hypothetical protein